MTRLDDLPDDCMMEVLGRLPVNDLFKLQRVNSWMKRLTCLKLTAKIQAVAFNSTDRFFPDPTHLVDMMNVNTIDQVLRGPKRNVPKCLHMGPISPDQELVPTPLINQDLRIASKRDFLLTLLTKCAGVKAIDLRGCQSFHCDLLLEVVERCEGLACVKIKELGSGPEEWRLVLEQIGDKIVHFVKDKAGGASNKDESEIELLRTLAEKCPNLKQIDWTTYNNLTGDFVAALKLLPKSCRVTFNCHSLEEFAEDLIDELDVIPLEWSKFGDRVERLSSLKFVELKPLDSDLIYGVNFVGLKKLGYFTGFKYEYSQQDVSRLIASQFPQLEEFCFNVSGLTEDNYDALFQKMESVKQLTISWDMPAKKDVVFHLPQSSIHRLKNLDTIDFLVLASWRLNDFLQRLEQYVDGIKTLKKLTIDMSYCRIYMKKTGEIVAKEVERMNSKQSRVGVEFVCKN